MVSRGMHQLHNIRLYFCDIGGSSVGVRNALKSAQFTNFVNKNEHLNFELFVRRGHHPYMTSTYINGYVRDTPLRNTSADQTLNFMSAVNNEFGRKALRHNENKVISSKRSVQGGW